MRRFRNLVGSLLCLALALPASHASDGRMQEEIRSFFISEDGGTLVIAGKRYHYVFFDVDKRLKPILQWEGRAKLKPTFRNFVVQGSQEISGEYTLWAERKSVAPEQEEFLVRNGFAP